MFQPKTTMFLVSVFSFMFCLSLAGGEKIDLCEEFESLYKESQTNRWSAGGDEALTEIIQRAYVTMTTEELRDAVMDCLGKDERNKYTSLLGQFFRKWNNVLQPGENAAFQMKCFFFLAKRPGRPEVHRYLLPDIVSPNYSLRMTDEETAIFQGPILSGQWGHVITYARHMAWFVPEVREKLFAVFLQRAINELRKPTEYKYFHGIVIDHHTVLLYLASLLRLHATTEYPAIIKKAAFDPGVPAEHEWQTLMRLMAGDVEAAKPAAALMANNDRNEFTDTDYLMFMYAYINMLERTMKTNTPLDELRKINSVRFFKNEAVIRELLAGNGTVHLFPHRPQILRNKADGPSWRLTVEGDMIVPRDPPAAQEGGGAPAAVAGAEASAEAGVGVSPVSP